MTRTIVLLSVLHGCFESDCPEGFLRDNDGNCIQAEGDADTDADSDSDADGDADTDYTVTHQLFYAVDDTYVSSYDPGEIMGDYSFLSLKPYCGEPCVEDGYADLDRTGHAVIRFDLSNADYSLDYAYEAYLALHFSYQPGDSDDGPFVFDIYRYPDNWDEGTLCWDNYDIESAEYLLTVDDSDDLHASGGFDTDRVDGGVKVGEVILPLLRSGDTDISLALVPVSWDTSGSSSSDWPGDTYYSIEEDGSFYEMYESYLEHVGPIIQVWYRY